jgi:hypothetical protein
MYRETSGSSSRPLMLKLVAILAVAPSSVSLDPLRRLGECSEYGSLFDEALREEGLSTEPAALDGHYGHLRNVMKRNCHQIVQSTEDFII